MELLVTIRKKESFDKVINYCHGVIVGSLFSLSYNLDLRDIIEINDKCKKLNKKIYLVLDSFVSENEKSLLFSYLEFAKKLDVDGIYFHDLAVFEIASTYGLTKKLIYDGFSVMCNSIEAAFYLGKGLNGVVLSRELTLEEITGITNNLPNKIDLQIFGHLRMSYSKRKFIKNYLKEINKDYDYKGKETLSLIEEQRDYRLPIIEDDKGTRIYTDYVLEMFSELPLLSDKLHRGIVDTLFIDDSCIVEVLRNYLRISDVNKEFLKQVIYKSKPLPYSSGYLYQKTNITKDE